MFAAIVSCAAPTVRFPYHVGGDADAVCTRAASSPAGCWYVHDREECVSQLPLPARLTIRLLVVGLLGAPAVAQAPPVPPPQLAPATPAFLSVACESLTQRLASLANTTISSATLVGEGTGVGGVPAPAHCRLVGEMFRRTSRVTGQPYAIGFELRLPTTWNGRFYYQANGGIDGNVPEAAGALGGGPVTGALAQGFAVLSSNAGHDNAANGGAAFGLDPQARLDYGYQAVAKLTPMAKEAIRLAYGKGPDRSYFGGCSNGGRHALVAAARAADHYDGFLAGAPGYNLPKAAVANIFGGQQYLRLSADPTSMTPRNLETAWTAEERTLVSTAVRVTCDALDGLADGIVHDVDTCQQRFDLGIAVPTCAGARDGTCLTAAQKDVVASIFAGPKTASGAAVYASFPYDTGHGTRGTAMWEFSGPLQLDAGAVGQIFKVPPMPATSTAAELTAWVMTTPIDTLVAQINATDATYAESAMSFMAPPYADGLSGVKRRGAKILVYHGVSDPIFSVNDTTAWYASLRAANGGDASGFARVFRVPGMGHCAGGPATDRFDLLSALVAWVERGTAPDAIVANARAGNSDLPTAWSPTRSRPLCAYPAVARYTGAGDIEHAASFTCR